jgi:uncharacterized membrane protein
MDNIRKLAWVQILTLIPFVIVKLLRTDVLQQSPPEWIKIFFLSFPNFCEAIVGTMTLTMIALWIKYRAFKAPLSIKNSHLYLLVVLLAGIYVITQELRIHNLGGNNVYDPYDILFSIIGLFVSFGILNYLKPVIKN